MTPSQLVEFYAGNAADIEGRRLEDILAFSDDDLEEAHDFIQWLFPLPEPSRFNPEAPLLTPEDIAAFYQPELQNNLRKSFRRILAFMGLSQEEGRVVEGPNFAERSIEVWEAPNHNWLRVTRILRSLMLLGLREEAESLYRWLDHEYTKRRFPINDESMRFWEEAVASRA